MLAKCRHMICTQKVDGLCIVFYQLLLPSLALVSPKRWESKPCKLIIYLVDLVPQAMNKLFSSLFIEMWDFFFFFLRQSHYKAQTDLNSWSSCLVFPKKPPQPALKKSLPSWSEEVFVPMHGLLMQLTWGRTVLNRRKRLKPGGTETVTSCCHSVSFFVEYSSWNSGALVNLREGWYARLVRGTTL